MTVKQKLVCGHIKKTKIGNFKENKTLRWVFTLFGAILANSNLYKKTIFKEILTKAIYQYEEGLFGNTPKLLFNRNIISIL